MKKSKTAVLQRYLDICQNAGPFKELEDFFDPSLRVNGPLFSSEGVKKYIAQLERDPPRGVDYTLLSSFESGEEAIFVIDFRKPPNETEMMVWGISSCKRITDLTLVFDTGALH